MKSRSLLAQVLVVNLLLVAGTVLVAIVITTHVDREAHGSEAVVVALGVVATLLGNWLLLHRRFEPLDRLISAMERIDLAAPHSHPVGAPRVDSAEVKRLQAAFDRMIARLEAERRQAGRAAIQAQERERHRIAQDLHDEVNQALTAVSLRLQATIEQAPEELKGELIETKQLSSQAMQELLTIARRLRPAVLDDHGLLAALQSQVQDFADQTGMAVSFDADPVPDALTHEQQLAIYRVTQESLSNIAQHAGAQKVEVRLGFEHGGLLRISDDGRGFREVPSGSLGLTGMRERALLAGGQLSIQTAEGHGTQVELKLA